MAEEAAFVLSLKKELLAMMPIDEKLVEEMWIEKYVNGDPSVLVEIQSAMLNKTTGGVKEMASLEKLMSMHATSCPVPESTKQVAMQKLEEDSFNLMMKQLEYDVQALRVARAKRASYESAVYHAKLQHRVKCYEDSMKAAEWFLVNNTKVLCSSSGEQVLQQFQAFVAGHVKKLRLDENAVVLCLEF
jgi:hypothetical protein